MILELFAAGFLITTPKEPSRILLSWPGDPSSTAAISWRTEEPTSAPVGEIALATPDPSVGDKALAVGAQMEIVELSPEAKAFYYTVRFDNLRPDTLYAYRVGSDANKSEWVQFRTASAEPKPFSFIYFGDAQNDIKSLWSRAIRQAFKHDAHAAFMIHAGDLVNKPNADNEWGEWFYAGGFIHAMIPSVAVPGNHEYTSGKLSQFWTPQFEYPRNGIPELSDTNYTFVYQGVRFIGLDSNRLIDEQAVWMDNVLKANRERWIVAMFHHPVFSTAQGRDNPKIRAAWQPIFEKHNVALVLQGHDHTYGRKNVPTGKSVRDKESGTVYVVSVSGPKMYKIGEQAAKTMARVGEKTQLYQLIRVDGNRLSYGAYTVTGGLYDSFALTKERDGRNRFEAQQPTNKKNGAPSWEPHSHR